MAAIILGNTYNHQSSMFDDEMAQLKKGFSGEYIQSLTRKATTKITFTRSSNESATMERSVSENIFEDNF